MSHPARPNATLHPYAERYEVHDRMPEAGVPRAEILAQLREMSAEEDRRGDTGRVSGSIYSGDHEHYAFLAEAFSCFGHVNVLQRDMYPSATKMESEILAMAVDMLHGDDTCGGLVTSGGTESLVSAMLAYRERARAERGILHPEVLMPVTAHPALDKAFHYFDITPVRVPITDRFQVDVEFVRDHVGPETVAIVASAGTYPHGVIDPIPELGQIALEHDIGLHVDGCLGGFILPWANELGYPVTPFDLGVAGVTSISADTHKYGYAFKGSSVVIFRPKDLRRHLYFMKLDWPGGMYSSPGMSGSRSGGIIASTWAAMLSLGRSGYRTIAADIFRTAAVVKEAVRSHAELQLLGDSVFNIAFGSDELDIFHVNDALAASGWRMNGLQLPPALHFCITRPNTAPGVVEAFVEDLARAVEYAKAPESPTPRSGALYGAGGTAPDHEWVAAGLTRFLDAIHEVRPLG